MATPLTAFITVTGLSAESGDDGQVGRGNRVNGLITPYRPMSLEAAAGKNLVTHVGKLSNNSAASFTATVMEITPATGLAVTNRNQRPISPRVRFTTSR